MPYNHYVWSVVSAFLAGVNILLYWFGPRWRVRWVIAVLCLILASGLVIPDLKLGPDWLQASSSFIALSTPLAYMIGLNLIYRESFHLFLWLLAIGNSGLGSTVFYIRSETVILKPLRLGDFSTALTCFVLFLIYFTKVTKADDTIGPAAGGFSRWMYGCVGTGSLLQSLYFLVFAFWPERTDTIGIAANIILCLAFMPLFVHPFFLRKVTQWILRPRDKAASQSEILVTLRNDALNTVGGRDFLTAVWDGETSTLRIEHDLEFGRRTVRIGEGDSGVIAAAWAHGTPKVYLHTGQGVVSRVQDWLMPIDWHSTTTPFTLPTGVDEAIEDQMKYVKSVIAVPIATERKQFGVLIGLFETQPAFPELDIQLLIPLANHAARQMDELQPPPDSCAVEKKQQGSPRDTTRTVRWSEAETLWKKLTHPAVPNLATISPDCFRRDTSLEKVVIKIRAKVVRMRHINVHGHDCTPPELMCPTESKVVEVEGFDVQEAKMEIDP